MSNIQKLYSIVNQTMMDNNLSSALNILQCNTEYMEMLERAQVFSEPDDELLCNSNCTCSEYEEE